MARSTYWKRPEWDLHIRSHSPNRPSRDAVERLSPEPFHSLHNSTSYNTWPSFQDEQLEALGLGLSFQAAYASEGKWPYDQQIVVGQNMQAPSNISQNVRSSTHAESVNGSAGHERPRLHLRKESSRNRDQSKGHGRSGSTIDTLATVALATSPTFTHSSPTTPQSTWRTIPYSTRCEYHMEERPSKRARSEKLPSPQWTRQESRPATSHVTSYESMRNDAELLLNFAQPQNFPQVQTSFPKQKTLFRSPSFTRLSQSSISSEPRTSAAGSATGDASGSAPQATHQRMVVSEAVLVESPTILDDPLWDVAGGKANPKIQKGDVKVQDSNVASVVPEQNLSNHIHSEEATMVEQKPKEGFTQDQSVAEADSVREEKRLRRIKPTTQTTSCTACDMLQSTMNTGEAGDSLTFWISCNGCKRWFHSVCVGFKDKREAQAVDKYICTNCESTHGYTTFVRKSSRARTAIDYAGLNEGIVQSSVDTPEHHYIKPIKEGKITFQPDDFARFRPELVTSEFLDKTDGMTRPIVIPACWNPRFGVREQLGKNTLGEEVEMCIDSTGSDVAVPHTVPILDGEEVMDCDQDALDMVMPRELTVRRVAELYGPEEHVEVIDVKSQSQPEKRWNMRKWADYYESTEDKVVRNVISLEVSQSKIGRLIRRPKFVRDVDLQDCVWPAELQTHQDFPKVQFYCLMSVADCYTDFHIDFGGSSVYYHILKGKKTFFFIPPEDKNLKKYEEWCNSETQNTTFLGEVTGECSRVDLSEGDTMLIPAGWIHAVWTPENSLVIGGNFLTHTHYEMQIKVAYIERDTKVARKFRYPFFQKIMWYTAIRYLEDDPVPPDVLDDFTYDDEFVFRRANPVWHEFGELANDKEPGDKDFNARFYSRKEIDGLPALRDYLYRTALIAGGFNISGGVTVDASRNVKRSIPKGHGDPFELIKLFGIWCAWKIGSVVAPEWTRPDSRSTTKLLEKQEKLKKPELARTPPERISSRVASQMEIVRLRLDSPPTSVKRSSSVGVESDDGKTSRDTPKASGLGPKRVACNPCRKRRIRCRHKEDGEASSADAIEEPRLTAQSNTSFDNSQPHFTNEASDFKGPGSPDAEYPDPNRYILGTPMIRQDGSLPSQPEATPETPRDTAMTVSSSKKGRSKACEECRKSKRRCIHDEFGRVDPAKAAEPSKPRGSTSVKRPTRANDEHRLPSMKKPKTESNVPDPEAETVLVGQAQSALAEVLTEQAYQSGQTDFNSLIDPALMADSSSLQPLHPPEQPSLDDAIQQIQAATDAMRQSANDLTAIRRSDLTVPRYPVEENAIAAVAKVEASEPPLNSTRADLVPVPLTANTSQTPAASLASPPDSLSNDADYPSATAEHTEPAKSIEVTAEPLEPTLNTMHTPNSASRHSSRQPKQVNRYVPETSLTTIKQSQKPIRYDRRASSSSTSALTSIGIVSRRSSPQAHVEDVTLAPTEPEKGASPSSHSRPIFRGRTSFEEVEADEESLKLIRALQEEEFGLRRRGMKA